MILFPCGFSDKLFNLCLMLNAEDAEELKQKKEKIAFQVSLALTCGDTWVSIPTHLEIMNTSRQFSVKLDVESLQPGAHFTEVFCSLSIVTLNLAS